jgi:predicted homoserine dehydrogenase-like protein
MMRVGIASANAGTPESIERSPMELGMIGLGRMGTDMVRRLLRTGPEEKAAVKKRSA